MEGPGIKPAENETRASSTRYTREGKRLTYRITVLQQPTRARACGSGAKSSADRRPVDPPPIVELKVFEGEEDQQRDVTYQITANYFLFATLENARHLAPARGGQNQGQLTVLTGTPVAGMVYLDRPSPAGYFIFPDLSVRHEGKYRLSFSLYEETKEAKDQDKDSDPSKGSDDAHVTHRLEVKSVPFTVYSAKKFPGLTESTALSRMVAEQGCRVRIRRDVRMRRREHKGGKDWDGYEDDMAEARERMSATPDSATYQSAPHGYGDPVPRPRSASNASHHSMAQPVISRRTSMQEMPQGYYQHPHGPTPHTPQSSFPQSSPYGPSSGQHYSQAPYVQPQSTMQPPPPHFSQPTYHAQPQAQSAAPPHGYYGYGSAPPPPQQQHYGAPPPAYESMGSQRISVDYSGGISPMDHRRSSAQLHIPPPPPPPTSTASQYGYQQPHAYQPTPPNSSYHHSHENSVGSISGYSSRPAPAEPPVRNSGISTPLSARPSFDQKLPSINTQQLPSISAKYLEPSSPASAAAPTGSYPGSSSLAPTPTETHKRGFGQVFNESHLHNPLRQGARPSDASSNYPVAPEAADDDDDAEPDFDIRRQMVYRRANGRQIARSLPVHN